MSSISATALRKDIYNVIAEVNANCKPLAITSNRGEGAVLIGESEWSAIEETLYLMGVPDLAASLLDGKSEPVRGCVDESDLEW